MNRDAIEGDLLQHPQLLDRRLRADDLADPVEELIDLGIIETNEISSKISKYVMNHRQVS